MMRSFKASTPVITGVDAFSIYCYLLKVAEHRDENTWGWYLLELQGRGFDPDYTIGDGAKGLRAGRKAAMPNTPCNGDVFQILKHFKDFVESLTRKVQGTTTSRLKQEKDIAKAQLAEEPTRSMTSKLVHFTSKHYSSGWFMMSLNLQLQPCQFVRSYLTLSS